MTDNPDYEKELAKLKIVNYSSRIILFIASAATVALIIKYNLLFVMWPLCITFFLFTLYFDSQLNMDEIGLMVKHGLIDREWKEVTERKLNEIVVKLAPELNVQQRHLTIFTGNQMVSVCEPRLPNSLVVSLKAIKEMNEEQLEFFIADTLLGFYGWSLFTTKYSVIIWGLPIFIVFPFVPLLPEDLLPLFGGSVIALILLALVFPHIAALRKGVDRYRKILSVTKDYESARSALFIESEICTRRIDEISRKMKIPRRSSRLSIGEPSRNLQKLRQAAEELGLEVEKG